jgi:hypothetical protein
MREKNQGKNKSASTLDMSAFVNFLGGFESAYTMLGVYFV